MLCPLSNCFAPQSNGGHQQLAYFTAFDFNLTLRASGECTAWVRGQLGAFISSLPMQYIRCSCMLAKWKHLITLKTNFFSATHSSNPMKKSKRPPKAKLALHPVCAGMTCRTATPTARFTSCTMLGKYNFERITTRKHNQQWARQAEGARWSRWKS